MDINTTEAAAELRTIMEREPRLLKRGFAWEHVPGANREKDTPEEIAEARAALEQDVVQFARAKQWILENLKPTARMTNVSSYFIKHVAEREIDYLANGTCIAAMLACGYRYKSSGINAGFNVTWKSVLEARDRVRGGRLEIG